ncbi:MAG: tetratricopeptide repeat protein, partial [Myxococcales bacterium]
MREADDELQEIKREIIESRSLVIKTNNLTNALSADIKSIAKRQQNYERRISWNSATAYVVFVVVVFSSLKFAVDARVDAIEAKYAHLGQQNTDFLKERDLLKEQIKARESSDMESSRFYDLLRQGRRVDLIRSYDAIKARPITKAEQAFFADAIEKARSEQAVILYLQAQDTAKLQRWQESASLLEESIKYKDDASFTPSVKLALSTAYRKLKRLKDAIPILMHLSEQSLDREVQNDALYFLAQCYEETESWNEAKNTWRTLLRKFPEARHATEAKIKVTQLANL